MREKSNTQYGLTQAQRRIWFMEMMNPGTSITTLSATYQIAGEIDTQLLERAATEIVKTYDAFRIRISGDVQNPTQWFEEPENVQARISRLVVGTAEQYYDWIKEVSEKLTSVFDEHLYQFTIIHFANGQVWLNLTINHIIADGLSVNALLHAVMENIWNCAKEKAFPAVIKPPLTRIIFQQSKNMSSRRVIKKAGNTGWTNTAHCQKRPALNRFRHSRLAVNPIHVSLLWRVPVMNAFWPSANNIRSVYIRYLCLPCTFCYTS